MDDSAPITWLINQINQIVNTGAASAASAIAALITPVAAVCFGIYIILITVNYMRGAESEPVLDFGMRIASFAIITSLGLNMSNYTSLIVPIVTGVGGDLAAAISGGTFTANSIDQLALHYFKILEEGYTKANAPMFPSNVGSLLLYFIKFLLIIVGLVPFLAAAALALIVADVGSVIVAMLGPMYFAFLLFPATRQYFSAWVNTAFSYALIPTIVAVIATISIGISKAMLGGNNLSETSLMSVFLATLGNLILLFLLKQVSSLASSLSAGGINAAMPGSIGSIASGMRASGAGTAREIQGGMKIYQALKNRKPPSPRGGTIKPRKAG